MLPDATPVLSNSLQGWGWLDGGGKPNIVNAPEVISVGNVKFVSPVYIEIISGIVLQFEGIPGPSMRPTTDPPIVNLG